ncbi:hypothetical protein Hanom_Chr01g00020121 [Helianthus anomalus]
MTFRGPPFETYLSSTSKDQQNPSRSYPSIRTSYIILPTVVQVKPGGWLTGQLTGLTRTSFTYRPNTDKVHTQVHQQTPPWL